MATPIKEQPTRTYYNQPVDTALQELSVDPKRGLTPEEVAKRQEQYGKNVLPRGESTSWIQLLIGQFTDLMVLILIGGAVISLVVGEVRDAIVILVIVVLNAAIGFYQEYNAERAVEALSAMQVTMVRVRRGGEVETVEAQELVPGDIVLLEEGDSIPADGRVVESSSMLAEEAALTGESNAVAKSPDVIEGENVALGDRSNTVYRGTSVTYGRGTYVVTETGLTTEIGKIAGMLASVVDQETPLQRRLDQLGKTLAIGALIVVTMVFAAGVLRGIPLEQMFLTAIGLAVAAVPEGLPALVTVGLSLGANRMVRRNALIRRLPAVETLGSVTTICSDKTGTLTRNEMTATNLAIPAYPDIEITGIGYTPEGEFHHWKTDEVLDPAKDRPLGRLLKGFALSTNAYIDDEDGDNVYEVVGDTTEAALLVAAQKVGWTRAALEETIPRVAELPFSSERKAMTTIHETQSEESDVLFPGAQYVAITKGAPDRLIEWSTHEFCKDGPCELSAERRKVWQERIDMMASGGLRVLGLAYRPMDSVPEKLEPSLERNLTLLGLVGILDPARTEAKESVKVARQAGIRTVMITGDHALTAEAIAKDLGILDEGQRAVKGADIEDMSEAELLNTLKTTSAFARVSPEHKLRIVKALQSEGQIVAMTGDGVNDAPALKQADIGVAMGITGTDVSKGAADMILTDDNFASIVAAVEEGRVVYDNIRKFLRYLISCNLGEILVMFVAIIAGMRVPLLAIQILWVNLVTDGLPAIALGFEKGEPGVMKRAPRDPKEGIFAGGTGFHIVYVGVIIMIITLVGFLYGHIAYGLEPFDNSLGLETFERAALVDLVGEETVPENWDTLSVEERETLILEQVGEGHSEEGGDGILDQAELLPRTMAFTVLALAQIFQIMAIHPGDRTSFFRVWFRGNMLLFAAVVFTFVLQLAVIYVPFFNRLLDTVPLTLTELLIALALASVTLFAVEIKKLFTRDDRPEVPAKTAA